MTIGYGCQLLQPFLCQETAMKGEWCMCIPASSQQFWMAVMGMSSYILWMALGDEGLCVSYATQNIYKIIHALYRALMLSVKGIETLSIVGNSLQPGISHSAKCCISTEAWVIIMCKSTHLPDGPVIVSMH